MKQKSVISYCSLIAAIMSATPATAAIRGNISRSYADSYNQVNNLRMGTVGGQNATAQNAGTYISAGDVAANAGVNTAVDSSGVVVELPIRVANAELAKKIGLGQMVGRVNWETLENCRRIYPDAEFAWDRPTMGAGSGGAQTCVMVVELYAENADGRGNKALMARANVAAGDNFKCNISDFPEYSYTEDAGKIEFPADNEPTVEDVVAQLNQEQKQNAGIKIAAGAVVGALGGNIAGKGERGSDSLLGTGKDKIKTSAVGALAGAAIMAGNSYAGKVGGDVILSTGVNAAAGGIVGNIMASGNSVLRIEDCNINGARTTCLWGNVVKTKEFKIGENEQVKAAFYNITNGDTIQCTEKKETIYTSCTSVSLRNIKLTRGDGKSIETMKAENNFATIRESYNLHFTYDKAKNEVSSGTPTDDSGIYAQIASATQEDGMPIRAMVADVHDKAMGYTADDWSKANKAGLKLWGRDHNGDAYALQDDGYTLDNFRPATIDAEDGGIIDINNKARLKSTLTGAGVGGAMGGFVGYQGAQSDIDERWVSAVREYKDSLTRVYCLSGGRYIGQYNDTIVVPELTMPEAE